MAELGLVYTKQYEANVYRMAQQRGSKLRNYVTIESMKGEVAFFERVKPTAAIRSNSLYEDSPMIHTPFDRRALRAYEYVWGDMVDWKDQLNMFIDPSSPIIEMGSYALGRVTDDIIIENAFSGPAYEGKEGLTPVPFPASQIIPITTGGSGGANAGMTIEKLRRARSLFGQADIDLDNPENKLYMAVSQRQLDDLLRTTEITNIDYNTVKALASGTVNSFMGFEFVPIERLTRIAVEGQSGQYIRTCAAWCKSGIKLAEPQPIKSRVSERADKNYNWYAHMKMKAGATRIEDAKVIQLPCLETY